MVHSPLPQLGCHCHRLKDSVVLFMGRGLVATDAGAQRMSGEQKLQ